MMAHPKPAAAPARWRPAQRRSVSAVVGAMPREAFGRVLRGLRGRAGPGSMEWLRGSARGACPNCGDSGRKDRRLRAAGPDGTWHVLLMCRSCSAGYFAPPPAPDYGAAPNGGDAALSFYLEQGAGTWGMASLLMSLGLPPGTRMVEVGCGFGFALDFARRALGWEVTGFDPSPFARVGAATLGLPIHPGLFQPGAAEKAAYDVVLASEMLEHVPDPRAVAAGLRAALAPGGVFVLTTPDVAAARPSTPSGLLAPLLSAGYHTVLQSWQSLEYLLRRAGFTDAQVRRSGPSLSACAWVGRKPLGQAPDRATYERWLLDVAETSPRPDLRLGMLARAYRERVAAGEPAAELFRRVDAECQARFGLHLDHPAPGGDAAAAELPAGLEDLLRREPACLGPLLLARAHERMGLGMPRSELTALLRAAIEASGRLRAALNRIGSDDGDAEDVAWAAAAELLLAAAEDGADDLPARLAALPAPAPGGPGRFLGIARRCFVILVNAGRLDQARRVEPLIGNLDALAAAARGAPVDADGLDALFCAAALELQAEGGDPARAARLLAGLRRRVSSDGGVLPERWQPIEAAETLALAAAGIERPRRPDAASEPAHPVEQGGASGPSAEPEMASPDTAELDAARSGVDGPPAAGRAAPAGAGA